MGDYFHNLPKTAAGAPQGSLFGLNWAGPSQESMVESARKNDQTLLGVPAPAGPVSSTPLANPNAAGAPSPEAPQPIPPPQAPQMSDVEMAQQMLLQNAQGGVVDPSQANLLAAQSTFVLPNGQVVDAATAQRLQGGGTRVNPGAMAQYQQVSGDALKARGEADELRREIGSSAMVVGESGRLQAENDAHALQGYMDKAAQVEQRAAKDQVDYNRRYKEFEGEMGDARAKFDAAAAGPQGMAGLQQFGKNIGLAIAAGIGAKASVLGNTRNFALDIMNQSLEADMQSQRDQVSAAGARINQVRGIFEDFRQKYGDSQVARQATLAAAKDALASKITKEAELHKGTETYEKSLQFAKSLELEAAQNRANALDLAGAAIYKQVYTKTPGVKLKTSAEWLQEQANLKKSINSANPAEAGSNLSEGSQNRIHDTSKRTTKLVEAVTGLSKAEGVLPDTGRTTRALGAVGLGTDAVKSQKLVESEVQDALINYWTGAGFSRAEAEIKADQVTGGFAAGNATKALHYAGVKSTLKGLLQSELGGLSDSERKEFLGRMRRQKLDPALVDELEQGRGDGREAENETFLGIRK